MRSWFFIDGTQLMNSKCGFHPFFSSRVVLVGERMSKSNLGLSHLVFSESFRVRRPPRTPTLPVVETSTGQLPVKRRQVSLGESKQTKTTPVLEEGLVCHRFTSAASDLQPQAKESTLDPQPGRELGH